MAATSTIDPANLTDEQRTALYRYFGIPQPSGAPGPNAGSYYQQLLAAQPLAGGGAQQSPYGTGLTGEQFLQLMAQQQAAQQQAAQQQAAAASASAATGAGTGGGATMANGSGGSYWGTNPQINQGGSGVLYNSRGQPLTADQTAKIMGMYSAYESGDMNAGMSAVKLAQSLGLDNMDQAVSNLRNQSGPNVAPTTGGPGQPQPETTALQQMGQIDPATEALRQGLSQSYLTSLNQAQNPSADQFRSMLNLYQQIDPQAYAQRQALGQGVQNYVTGIQGQTAASPQEALAQMQQLDPASMARMGQLGDAMQSYLSTAQQQAALGSQLDPETAREVDQATREAQMARGNVYGTPQLVQEAMTRGQAGLALQQQRLQNLQAAGGAMQGYLTSGATPGAVGEQLYGTEQQRLSGALGQQQGYLTSGASLGDTALNLYQMQQNQLRANQGAALGYLGSGQTPYQAGSAYLQNAQNQAATAAGGGPSYQPQGPSGYYTGTGTSSFPQYGLDTSQLANQYMQSMNYGQYTGYGLTPQKSQGGSAMGAGVGALGGAASGALAGSVVPGVGTLAGAAVGALGGAAKGYFSG
jgi:hypothetical protein